MATYLQGVTDYIPQLQPFRPDFNFYNKALSMKQGKYDAAHKKLSNLYGSLLNSPMLREENIENRDAFFKAIDQDIQKMAGMDLSLQQNQDAAAGVFNQLLEDKNIVKDMVWTKNWQKEHQRADGFRNCVDPEKCGGAWWEEGVTALNYMADEFKNASADEALNFSNAKYTPYQDVMKMALDLAKEADFQIQPAPEIRNGYMITTKNGQHAVGPLQTLFAGSIGKDPKVMDYYRTKAYVDRKNWTKSNAAIYGSEGAAEQAYMNQMLGGTQEELGRDLNTIETESHHTKSQAKQLEEKIAKEGTRRGSTLAEQYKAMMSKSQQLDSSQEVVKEAHSHGTQAGSNPVSRMTLKSLDNAVAAATMGKDIGKAAQIMAYRDYEVTKEADAFALENVRHSNRLALAERNFDYAKKLAILKADLKGLAEKSMTYGGHDQNVPEIFDLEQGGTAINLSETAAVEATETEREQRVQDLSRDERALLKNAMDYAYTKASAEPGGTATQDLIQLTDTIINKAVEAGSEKGFFGPEGESETSSWNNVLSKWNNKTDVQKKQWVLKNKDLLTRGLGTAIPGHVVDAVYDDFLAPKLKRGDGYNSTNRSYLDGMWNDPNVSSLMKNIKVKQMALDEMDVFLKEQAPSVIGDMTGDNNYERFHDFLPHYIGENGVPRNAADFATKYAEAQSQKAGNETSYEDHYAKALQAYTGEYTGEGFMKVAGYINEGIGWANLTTPIWEAVNWTIGGDDMEIYGKDVVGGIVAPSSAVSAAISGVGQTIHDAYRQGWHKYANTSKAYQFAGLSGTGSLAAQGMRYRAVDPSSQASNASMGLVSFLKDVNTKGETDARIDMGYFGNEIPEESAEGARVVLDQVYRDFVSRTNPKDYKRPILDISYADIAGNDSEWTALNIKANEQYVRDHIGTEKNKGLYADQYESLISEGITTYLRKDVANNLFRQNATKTVMENFFDYGNEYAIDAYPGASEDMKITRSIHGGYQVAGNMNFDVDENGNYETGTFVKDYPANVRIDDIVTGVEALLREQDMLNQMKLLQFNDVFNPQDLLED